MIANHNVLLYVFVLFCDSFATLNKGDNCSFQDGKAKLMKKYPTTVHLIKRDAFPVNPPTSRRPGDISRQKCKEYAEYAYEKIPAPTLLLYPHFTKKLVCDRKNRLGAANSLAARREFPHMALIGYKSDEEYKWYRGGSLISESFVLTAAHCLSLDGLGVPKLVRVGLTNKSDPAHMQERTVSEIYSYPAFDYPNVYHDIGLLRLSKNIECNTYARPACLKTNKYIPYHTAHISGIASGWGERPYVKALSNDSLLATVLDFYSAAVCNYTYKTIISAGKLEQGIVNNLMICAGNSEPIREICAGGGGGPLQVYHSESKDVKCMYDIVGVMSIGGICISGIHLFTRVSAYIKWIEDIVWPY